MSPASSPTVSVRRTTRRDGSTLAQDVLDGLARELMELPPKHLYDERGSQLFDDICGLPEYYPTRTERAILEANASRIARSTGAAELVELGCGTAAKTRVLLDALATQGTLRRYVAFDIDESMVKRTAAQLADEYPQLEQVEGVVGDFEHDLGLISAPVPGRRRAVALLGGTIGNFPPAERRALLRAISRLLGPEDHLLLGADLVKDPAVIEAAYNDSAGVTAEFNRNVLHVINRELDADFPVERFAHVAFYDREQEWIEMRLRALEQFSVRIDALDMELGFSPQDEIRTEISAKFSTERLQDDLGASGLRITEVLRDHDGLFALVLARPTGGDERRAAGTEADPRC